MQACSVCGKQNADDARFCSSCSAALNTPTPTRRKLATLLFCDMSGSTKVGEQVDAEAVRELMFRYFHEMRAAIERHGGTVEKFIGDAVHAVFGVPVAHEDDAVRALRAATGMRDRLDDLNLELERRYGTTIELRIGVNTGEVVAGDPSARETFATGDAVNVAARLEQAARPGEILIGEQTLRLAGNAASVEPVEPLTLKGKSQPVAAYRLIGVARDAAAPRAPGARLVGRDAELTRLRELFERARAERECRLVTVVGEPGVGKSRLAAEFLSGVAADAGELRGRCLPYGEGITYWAIGEIVRQAAGIRDDDSPEEAIARIGRLVGGLADGERIAERVGVAIGLSASHAAPEEISWAIRDLLEERARDKPLVVLIDDLQWAEPALLDLLAALPARVEAPLVVLCLARPELLELRPEWTPTVRLEPLTTDDAGRLVDDLAAGLDADVRDRVIQTTGGNPLFVEELVGMVAAEAGETGGGHAELELPLTINALLNARLDRLPESERGTLERGAVEGEVFHRGAVVALSAPSDSGRVGATLQTLSGRELIAPASARFVDEAAFRFRHLLVREAAYHATAKRQRAAFHELFAGWLTQKAGDRAAEVEEILGYHLEQAYSYCRELGPVDDRARALARGAAAHLLSAGRRASSRGDMPAAAKLWARAERLIPSSDPRRLRLLPDLAEALIDVGEFDTATRLLDEADERAVELGDGVLAALATVPRLRLGGCLKPAQFASARGPLEEAMEPLENAGEHVALAKAQLLMTSIVNSPGERAAYAERALENARRAQATREEANALELRCWLAMGGEMHYEEAIELVEVVLDEASGRPMLEARVLTVLASLHAVRGRFDEAYRLNARAIHLNDELGDRTGLAFAHASDGVFAMLAEDFAAAEPRLREVYTKFERLGDVQPQLEIAPDLACALHELGRDDEAERVAEFAERAAGDASPWLKAGIGAVRAGIRSRRGEHGEAERLVREAVDLGGTVYPAFHAFMLMRLGEVLLRAGRPDEAFPVLRESERLYDAKGHVAFGASRTRALLAELHAVA